MTAPVIEIKNLVKTYKVGFFGSKLVKAVDDISLSIAPGMVFGIVGPNGAGKSTTIKVLLNLVKPTSGVVTILGMSPTDPKTRRTLGFLPENPAPYPHLTAREFVTMSGQLAGLSGKELSDRVSRCLERVEMSRAHDLQIRRMSKGMVQRTALAQALVASPRLLVLDEPTSGLDPLGRRQFRDLILSLRDEGVSVLLCTHIISDVESLCDEVALIVGGKVRRAGPLRTILAEGASETELEVVGLSLPEVEGLAVPLVSARRVEQAVLVRVAEGDANAFLRKVLAANGSVTRLQPVRRGLEELFVDTVRQAGRLVGSEFG